MSERPVPTTYKAQIAGLKKRVAHLEVELRDRDARLRAKGIRAWSQGVGDKRCEECGVVAGEPCRAPSDRRLSKPHHIRGRTAPCGLESCTVCAVFFDGLRAEAAE